MCFFVVWTRGIVFIFLYFFAGTRAITKFELRVFSFFSKCVVFSVPLTRTGALELIFFPIIFRFCRVFSFQ